MLVSRAADETLRRQVSAGTTPCPEFLRLEAAGVDLLDWSRLDAPPDRRGAGASWRHAQAALRLLSGYDAVFSDGEHVGIPLAMAMRVTGRVKPHLVLGHHVTAPAKRPFFTVLAAHRGMSRVLVHSTLQLERAHRVLGIPREKLAFVPYSVDADYWRPQADVEDRLVVSAGIEHRDYATLAAACEGLDARVYVACGSLHSPAAKAAIPTRWPANFEVGFADRPALRAQYARAAVVVVPLLPNDFQAGITTLLEAMAMGKAVVVTATAGQADVVTDGLNGILVAPGDAGALRRAVGELLADPHARARLGRNARSAVEREYGLATYCRRLTEHLASVAQTGNGSGPES
jgi:glycosyltransferase involved in cell wall biosynthesis